MDIETAIATKKIEIENRKYNCYEQQHTEQQRTARKNCESKMKAMFIGVRQTLVANARKPNQQRKE
jgi:hypothetical protein